jgi:MFS family permease
MDTYFPATIVAYLEVFRQYFPAQHFTYFRGYLWALAMLGTTRKCMTNIARTCVFVERHLASWERFLAEAHWDVCGVSRQFVQLLQEWGSQWQIFEALRMVTSILVYIPVAKLADQHGRTPFVVLSFVCFAFFPFLLASAQEPVGLIAAFVCAGLREIGEPARKAMIVDLADAAQRGRMVGVYYFTRGLVVMPASLVGGMLWRLDLQTPFFVAAGVCLLGLVLLLAGRRSGMASTE